MLSRTANNLFWLSRYIERAENIARLIEVGLRLDQLPIEARGEFNIWESTLATAAASYDFFKFHSEANATNVIEFLISSHDNPYSIRACIEQARTNARGVRTALTVEMWESINESWLELNKRLASPLTEGEIHEFLQFIKQASIRFDGAAYRTMLRNDAYWFQRLGLFIERADNTARMLDVKYHMLLPSDEQVGGSLDYYQWAAVLRSVSAFNSFAWVYKESVKPWLVADFLVLKREQPRSLISLYDSITMFLDQLAEYYSPCMIRETG